jgi:integrase
MKLWQHPNRTFYILFPGNKRRSLRTKDFAKAKRLFKKTEIAYLENRLTIIGGKSQLLSSFIEEYNEFSKGMAPSTRREDRIALEHFKGFWGDKPMNHLTDKDLDQFRGFLRSRFPNTWTVNKYIRTVKTALRTARKWKYLRDVNLDEFRQYPLDYSKPTYLSKEELRELLNASQEHSVMRSALPLQIYCGISRAEIMGPIHITDDHIEYKRQKTSKLVRIPISDSLRPYIEHLGKGIVRIVPWGNPRTYSRHFERIAKQSGVKVSPHKLRHTFATLLLAEGVDISTVSELLGHASIDITKRHYAHVQDRTTPDFHPLRCPNIMRLSFTRQ